MIVLSIDIDYAYSPTISSYDDYVEGSRISIDEQREILSEINAPAPKVNLEKLKLLKSVVKHKTTESTNIIIAEHHHEILKYLPHETRVIYNFDHHHDIFYPGWHDLEKLDEGNWVSFLRGTNLEEYNWVRNDDSEDYEADIELGFKFKELYLDNVDSLPTFDILFCCSSMHWTGEEGRKNLLEVLGG